MRGVSSMSLCMALCVTTAMASSWPWPWGKNTTRTTTLAPSASSEFEWGVAAALGFDDISPCYKDSRTGLDDLWEAVQDYKQGGYVAKVKALAKIAGGIHSVLNALQPCSQSMTDATKYEALIKDLKDPRYYSIHNALTLALNLAEDRHQMSSFVDAWDKADYRTAGFQITSTLLDVLTHPGIPSSNGTEAVQIGIGIAEGFVSDVPLKCFTDLKVEVPAIVSGVIDIYTVVKALAGFESLFHGLEGLVPCYKQCLADKKQIVDLLHELEDFRHPAELAKKIMENVKKSGVDLSLDTASAILAYKGGEWKQFGMEIGKILGQVIILPAAVVVV